MLEPIPKDEYSSFNTLTFAQSVDSAEQMMVGLSLATTCSFITRLEFHRAQIVQDVFEYMVSDFPKLRQVSIEKCPMVSDEQVLDFFAQPWSSHIELFFVSASPIQFKAMSFPTEKYGRAYLVLLLRYAYHILAYQPQLCIIVRSPTVA